MSVLRFTALLTTAVVICLGQSAQAIDGPIRPVAHFDYYRNAGCASACDSGCASDGCASPGCASNGCASASCAAPGCAAPSCAAPCSTCCSPSCGLGLGLADLGGSSLFNGSLLGGLTLQELLLGDCSPIQVGGWTQVGYHDETTAFTPQTALSFNNRQDRLNLHQQWFFAEKVADGSNGLDWGFRADVVYGIDGADTQAFGNPAGSWDYLNGFDHGAYSWALPQAYLELASGDLSVKLGHFFTIIGYEVITAPDNFFYSHAFTMYNSEPFTHTGVLATYNTGDVTWYGGWSLGWDSGFSQFQGGNNFLGGVSFPLMDDVTVTYITTAGDFGWRGDDGYSHSIVVDTALTDNLNWVVQSDMVDANSGGAFANDDSVGVNNYFFYTVNDWIRTGSRMEWWKGDGNSHYAVTSGVNLLLADNFIVRPEYRTQWAPSNGVRDNILGMDAIWTY